MKAYLCVILAAIILGAISGICIKHIFSAINHTKKSTLSYLGSSVIGAVVTLFTGGLYAINAFNTMMKSMSDNLMGYQLSIGLGSSYGADHFKSLSEKLMYDLLDAVYLGFAATVVAIVVAFYLKIKKQ